jgi:hypothetical protein
MRLLLARPTETLLTRVRRWHRGIRENLDPPAQPIEAQRFFSSRSQL